MLISANIGLLESDVPILLDGNRFTDATEVVHTHECNVDHMDKAREAHLSLAVKFGWHVVNANQSEGKVGEDIWDIVSDLSL